MKKQVLLITPPFTQLNTPYPATAYLKGFLNTKNILSFQMDLGIEVIGRIFSKKGLIELFDSSHIKPNLISENALRIYLLKNEYIHTIDNVISFLQGKQPALAHLICQESYLPEASRFNQLEELDWAFGSLGIQDKAKHLATLYLEDIADFIQETIDPHFGFSRYAERLGRSALSFDALYDALQLEFTYVDHIMLELLEKTYQAVTPQLICFSVPFPGNLYAAFRCASWLKKNYPAVKIAMGGGFPNTELRSISDKRVFEFFDFITLDDGEAPIEQLVNYITHKSPIQALKRTFCLNDGKVSFINNKLISDYKQRDLGTPDYSDLLLDSYISVIEIVNPMHRMWSDGRWNKLTMAHGCYWGKCTFCDISLDYIQLYEPATAKLICDRMEELIAQTGQNGFHFVDEAAPPALMREVALEIIRRNLTVIWWTNIRFEKSFTKNLCKLLKKSGCIAVSGGLEVASDRLLQLIDKGVTVEDVARVAANFTDASILVHAYLMYGFPTQSIQETIDSLEMVRQLFEIGIIQSGFWHQFAMTAHSPVGLNPEKYHVKRITPLDGSFANNDLIHEDLTGIDHSIFSYGLKKSLFNFMHGIGFEIQAHEWFNDSVRKQILPRTKIQPNFIANALNVETFQFPKDAAKIYWLGNLPLQKPFIKRKKGNEWELLQLTFHSKSSSFSAEFNITEGQWFVSLLEKISIHSGKTWTLKEVRQDYDNQKLEDFELFWFSKPMQPLLASDLLVI